MLSAKPWKLEAMVRLFVGVLFCISAGSLAVAALHGLSKAGQANWQLYAAVAAAACCLGTALYLLRKPWRLDTFTWTMGILMSCFYASLFLGVWVGQLTGEPKPSVSQMVVTVLSFQGAALLLTWRFVREHEVSWTEAFGLAHRWRYALLCGFILACLFLPFAFGLQWLVSEGILRHLHLKAESQQAVQTLQMAHTWGARLVLGVVTILLVPPAEEILFRGILYPFVKQAGYPRLAFWGTSLLFGAVHLNVVTLLPLTVFALGLAALYELTDNLLAPIAAHALFNGFNFLLLYSSEFFLKLFSHWWHLFQHSVQTIT